MIATNPPVSRAVRLEGELQSQLPAIIRIVESVGPSGPEVQWDRLAGDLIDAYEEEMDEDE